MKQTPHNWNEYRQTRRRARLRRRAFTLAELTMVLIIIGIVATLAIPRLALLHGSGEGTALLADLRIVRNAIELYASEHGGVYPGQHADGAGGAALSEAAFISQLTQYSRVGGQVSVSKSASHPFGPYLFVGIPPLPVGPNKGSTEVLIVAVEPVPRASSDAGWIYNPTTGEFIGNVGGEVGGDEVIPDEILDRLELPPVGVMGVGGMGL